MAARKPKARLSRERIVATALARIEAEGADELSMRKLAAELGVDPMSIYYHLPDKQALMLAVFDLVLAELPLPDSGLPWRDGLRAVGRQFHRLAIAYPKVFPLLIASPYATPREAEVHLALRDLLLRAGFGAEDCAGVTQSIYTYAVGVARTAAHGLRLKPFYEPGVEPPAPGPPMTEAEVDFSIELMIAGIGAVLAGRQGKG
jgi:AcrR family transcriptional regulator